MVKTHPINTRAQIIRRYQGFTILELLVVITIIVIIAALGFRGMNMMTERGHRTKCGNNIRQIAQAAIAYSADNEGHLPPPNWDDGTSNTGFAGWAYLPPNLKQPEHIEAGALWPYINNREMFFCPIDYLDTTARAKRKMQIATYSMNGSICGFGASNGGPKEIFRTSHFQANDIMLWEQEEGPDGFWYNDGSNSPTEGITNRHGGGAWVGCMDGHIEWLKVEDYNLLRDQNVRNRLWCNPLTANGR